MAKELIKKSLPTLYLSARANPDQVRIDLWNGLYQAAERLETRKAKGSDTAELEAYITSHTSPKLKGGGRGYEWVGCRY